MNHVKEFGLLACKEAVQEVIEMSDAGHIERVSQHRGADGLLSMLVSAMLFVAMFACFRLGRVVYRGR